jgi:hypothetical protein
MVNLYDYEKDDVLVGHLSGVVDWSRRWITFRVKAKDDPSKIVTLVVPYKWCKLSWYLQILHAIGFAWLDNTSLF